jgi:hypothetical protein
MVPMDRTGAAMVGTSSENQSIKNDVDLSRRRSSLLLKANEQRTDGFRTIHSFLALSKLLRQR